MPETPKSNCLKGLKACFWNLPRLPSQHSAWSSRISANLPPSSPSKLPRPWQILLHTYLLLVEKESSAQTIVAWPGGKGISCDGLRKTKAGQSKRLLSGSVVSGNKQCTSQKCSPSSEIVGPVERRSSRRRSRVSLPSAAPNATAEASLAILQVTDIAYTFIHFFQTK